MLAVAVFMYRSSVASVFLDNIEEVRDFLTIAAAVVVADVHDSDGIALDENGSGDFGRVEEDVEEGAEFGIERRRRLLRSDLRLVFGLLEYMLRFAMAI